MRWLKNLTKYVRGQRQRNIEMMEELSNYPQRGADSNEEFRKRIIAGDKWPKNWQNKETKK